MPPDTGPTRPLTRLLPPLPPLPPSFLSLRSGPAFTGCLPGLPHPCCSPEYSTQGFHPTLWSQLTTTLDGPEVEVFKQACKDNGGLPARLPACSSICTHAQATILDPGCQRRWLLR